MSRRTWVPAIAAFILQANCADPVAPVLVRPQLENLVAIDPFWSALVDTGFVAVSAQIPAAGSPLGENERIEILLEVSNGDIERPLLQKLVCDSGQRACTLVSVTMHEGATLADIAPGISNSSLGGGSYVRAKRAAVFACSIPPKLMG